MNESDSIPNSTWFVFLNTHGFTLVTILVPRYQPHLSVPHSLPANTSLSVITEVRSEVGLLTSIPFIFNTNTNFPNPL